MAKTVGEKGRLSSGQKHKFGAYSVRLPADHQHSLLYPDSWLYKEETLTYSKASEGKMRQGKLINPRQALRKWYLGATKGAVFTSGKKTAAVSYRPISSTVWQPAFVTGHRNVCHLWVAHCDSPRSWQALAAMAVSCAEMEWKYLNYRETQETPQKSPPQSLSFSYRKLEASEAETHKYGLCRKFIKFKVLFQALITGLTW